MARVCKISINVSVALDPVEHHHLVATTEAVVSTMAVVLVVKQEDAELALNRIVDMAADLANRVVDLAAVALEVTA